MTDEVTHGRRIKLTEGDHSGARNPNATRDTAVPARSRRGTTGAPKSFRVAGCLSFAPLTQDVRGPGPRRVSTATSSTTFRSTPERAHSCAQTHRAGTAPGGLTLGLAFPFPRSLSLSPAFLFLWLVLDGLNAHCRSFHSCVS